MANTFTDAGTVWANYIAASYDQEIEFQLRDDVLWRDLVDKRPQAPTNPGATITMSLGQEFAALATTPLTETVDPDAVAPPAPVRVTVTVNEYGNTSIDTLRLKETAFIRNPDVDGALANLIGKNMIDTIDALVRTTADAATNVLWVNGGNVTTAGSNAAVVGATDIMSSKVVRSVNDLLSRRKVKPRMADNWVALIHPDVAADILADTGWLSPHQYQDTTNIYQAELGTYLNSRFMQTTRITTSTDGASSAKVYRTYFMGKEALVEATIQDPHTVVGPQVDKLRRFFPIGWYAFLGWNIYRNEAIQVARTGSSYATL